MELFGDLVIKIKLPDSSGPAAWRKVSPIQSAAAL